MRITVTMTPIKNKICRAELRINIIFLRIDKLVKASRRIYCWPLCIIFIVYYKRTSVKKALEN